MYFFQKGVKLKIRKELAKGSASLLVLSLLAQEDMYGYQIIKELETKSKEIFCMKEGTLYPILHALEKDGFLSSYWENSHNAHKRKYYKITENGRKELQEQKEEWNLFSTAVNQVVKI